MSGDEASRNSKAVTAAPAQRPARKPQHFRYEKPPPELQGRREVVRLCQIPTLQGSVQVVRRGGSEHLHSHASVDGFWMVLSGRVAFEGESADSRRELGPGEGLLMPRGNRYRFEALGDEDAEILQVAHIDDRSGFTREDHEPARVERDEIKVIVNGRVMPALGKK
jgi:mannose-6-phosphate isomerase-like protein (cupin superfamily)